MNAALPALTLRESARMDAAWSADLAKEKAAAEIVTALTAGKSIYVMSQCPAGMAPRRFFQIDHSDFIESDEDTLEEYAEGWADARLEYVAEFGA